MLSLVLKPVFVWSSHIEHLLFKSQIISQVAWLKREAEVPLNTCTPRTFAIHAGTWYVEVQNWQLRRKSLIPE